jgi:hypothetical protein
MIGDRHEANNLFESMSADELWILHEKLRAILSMKLDAEKHELERLLAQLNGRIEARRPYSRRLGRGRRPSRSGDP